jgi:ubiquinone/menaquinone biosynthesis C-methylase UbiE
MRLVVSVLGVLDFRDYYSSAFDEQERLAEGVGELERVRTQELLTRQLPPAPATVLDVGGAAGVYALWLARLGYQVHLVDPVARHVEQAQAASQAQPDHPIASCGVGDARSLSFDDASADVVLLLGPLYHLTERTDRLTALAEAHRVLKPGGLVVAAGISRFASMLACLSEGLLDDPDFLSIVRQDLRDGQHRNPTDKPYFTTAYFHHPDELRAELAETGFTLDAFVTVEGPAMWMPGFAASWASPDKREVILELIRTTENEISLAATGSHFLGIARA